MKKGTTRITILFLCILLLTLGGFSVNAVNISSSNCPKQKNAEANKVLKNMQLREMKGFLPSAVYEEAKVYANSMDIDGSWKDIDYNVEPAGPYPAAAHIERLRKMARAYIMPNQPYFENPELLEKIILGLPVVESKMLKMQDGIRYTPGNWWWWNLDLPPKLGFVLTCVRDHLDPATYQVSMDSLRWCLSNPLEYYLTGLYGQSANGIAAIRGNLYYQALIGNEENLRFIASEFARNFAIIPRGYEGIAAGDTFIAHNMLDFFAYYPSFLNDSISILEYLVDTEYMLDSKDTDILASSLANGAFWVLYKGYRDIGTSGRNISGPFTKTESNLFFTAANFFTKHSGNYKESMQNIIDRVASGMEAKVGHKHFSSGDLTVSKTEDSYVSVRMHSDRVKAAEAWGGQGQINYHMGDGCMWIFNDVTEFYETNTFPCYDWDRVAGTTVVDGLVPYRLRESWFGAEPFTGGVSDGQNGVSAMNLSMLTLPLTAQKSWFFFDDEIVCLGSGISSSTENDTLSIIDQRPILSNSEMIINGNKITSSSNYKRTQENVSWMSLNNVGYYFPQVQNVELEMNQRTGSWYLLDYRRSTNPLSERIANYYINHGKNSDNSKYAYAVLPNKTTSQTKEYAEGSTVEVIENSEAVHSVKDLSSGDTGIVFWPDNRDILKVVLPKSEVCDGIRMFNIELTEKRTIGVTVKGESGVASADPSIKAQCFTVVEQRLSGDVDLEVRWFDDASCETGSYWKVGYLTKNGVKYSETIPYKYTDQWTTTVVQLNEASFSGDGLLDLGVEMIIGHSNASVDSTQSKYELIPDWSFESLGYPTTLYGPIINSLKLSPRGKTATYEYSNKSGIIEADSPCIVYYKNTEDGLLLSLCEPQHLNKTVTLTIDGLFDGVDLPRNISCLKLDDKTKVSFQVSQGATYTAKLKSAGTVE